MPDDPMNVVKKLTDSFNDRTLEEKAEELYAPDLVIIGAMPPGGKLEGPKAMAACNAGWYDSITPDLKATIRERESDGEDLKLTIPFGGSAEGAVHEASPRMETSKLLLPKWELFGNKRPSLYILLPPTSN